MHLLIAPAPLTTSPVLGARLMNWITVATCKPTHKTEKPRNKSKSKEKNVKLSPKWLALRSVHGIMDQLPYRLHRVDSLFIIYYYCCYYLVLFDFSSRLLHCLNAWNCIYIVCWELKTEAVFYKPYFKQSESRLLWHWPNSSRVHRIETINKNAGQTQLTSLQFQRNSHRRPKQTKEYISNKKKRIFISSFFYALPLLEWNKRTFYRL